MHGRIRILDLESFLDNNGAPRSNLLEIVVFAEEFFNRSVRELFAVLAYLIVNGSMIESL